MEKVIVIIGTDNAMKANYLRQKLAGNVNRLVRFIKSSPNGSVIISDLSQNPNMVEFIKDVESEVHGS